MRYYTPGLVSTNGWAPKVSPNGRFLVRGIITLFGTDLYPGGSGTPVEVTITSPSGDFRSAGFISDAACYAEDFATTSMQSIAVPSWAPAPILIGTGATGSAIGANGGHWGTYHPTGPVYYIDGVPWTPGVGSSPVGLNIAGEWAAYFIAPGFIAVEKIDHSESRVIPVAGVLNWRLFAGPDGAYVFYGLDGLLWINNPLNVSIIANLPGTDVESVNGGFGALSWRLGQLWVTTYAYKSSEARYYALHRPVGESKVIALPNIGANNFSMEVGQGTTGWTIAGASDGHLDCWFDIAYNTPRSSFEGSGGQGEVFLVGAATDTGTQVTEPDVQTPWVGFGGGSPSPGVRVLTRQDSFSVAAASEVVVQLELQVCPAVIGRGCGRLVHPVLGAFDYEVKPDEWVGLDSVGIVVPPLWASTRTLTNTANTLWEGNLKDAVVEERWKSSGGLSMPMTQLRMLMAIWTMPIDPDVGYVRWYPNYVSDAGWKVLPVGLEVGGQGIVLDDVVNYKDESGLAVGWVTAPVVFQLKLVEPV